MSAPIKTEDSFHQLIHRNHMWGLWEIASQMTPQPRPQAIPYQWKWSVLEDVVRRSATAVPVGDERRGRLGPESAGERERDDADDQAGDGAEAPDAEQDCVRAERLERRPDRAPR